MTQCSRQLILLLKSPLRSQAPHPFHPLIEWLLLALPRAGLVASASPASQSINSDLRAATSPPGPVCATLRASQSKLLNARRSGVKPRVEQQLLDTGLILLALLRRICREILLVQFATYSVPIEAAERASCAVVEAGVQQLRLGRCQFCRPCSALWRCYRMLLEIEAAGQTSSTRRTSSHHDFSQERSPLLTKASRGRRVSLSRLNIEELPLVGVTVLVLMPLDRCRDVQMWLRRHHDFSRLRSREYSTAALLRLGRAQYRHRVVSTV